MNESAMRQNVAEEYCWAMTQAALGGHAVADRVPVSLSLGFQLDCLVYTYIDFGLYQILV